MTDEAKVPTVSVIIPTYNRAHLLGRAIRSVLAQTYHDYELIVVDDGSTDNTQEIVRDFSDDRIKYIRHDKNKGGAAARNSGIKAAAGQYIAFQDDDDVWQLGKLQKQIEAFEGAPPEVGVVYADLQRLDERGKEQPRPTPATRHGGDIHRELLRHNFIGTPTALVRRECFDRVGMFAEQLPRLQDWELWIRISKHYHFTHLDEILVHSYRVPDSISSDAPGRVVARKYILKEHFEAISQNRRLLADHVYGIGTDLCHQGEMDLGRPYILQAVKIAPLNIRFVLAALVSLFGPKAYRKLTELSRAVFR
jgi:glycosyltransferase involved in cell wall biosynthesis